MTLAKKFWLQKRGKVFYALNSETGQKESLRIRDPAEAERLINSKNEASIGSAINLSIAKAYLQAADPKLIQRTWQDVMNAFIDTGSKESSRTRKKRAVSGKLFNPLRQKKLVETTADDFLAVLKLAGVYANGILRCLHNLARGLGWLPWEVLPLKLWPKPNTKPKRGVTDAEQKSILAAEQNVERRHYYELVWEVGAAQTDAANLTAENIDWETRTLSFQRMKTGESCFISIGARLEALLKQLPAQGPLFPKIHQLKDKDRSAEFARRCRLLKIEGISLHSYRYAWAERAASCGVPERFAQAALGHSSKAVHRAYAKKAVVKVPSLEEYETAHEQKKLVPVQFAVNG